MNYTQRIKFAILCSVLLHAVGLAMVGAHRDALGFGPNLPSQEPIILKLDQNPAAMLQLVDTQTPAKAPVSPTGLISDMDSNATDKELRDGDKPGPQLEERADHDVLGGATPAAEPSPEPAPSPEPPAPAPTQESMAAPAEPPQPEKAPTPPEKPAALHTAAPPKMQAPAKSEGAMKVARADMPKPPETAPAPPAAPKTAPGDQPSDLQPGPSKGRVYDQVKDKGIAGFEALRDEIAPYLKEIRRVVERRWNMALLTRYSGVSPTLAVVDCAIASDGHLVSVELVDTPQDPIYAALCKEAIEKAGPFRPFPFQVPDLYRNRNLEIRWTFSYLR